MTIKRAHSVAAVLIAAIVGGFTGGFFGASMVAAGFGTLGAVLSAVLVIYGRYIADHVSDGVRYITNRFGFVGGVGVCVVVFVGNVALIAGYLHALRAMPFAGFFCTLLVGFAVGSIRERVVGD
ncbi:hypothetical protein [Spirillospora sp. CA-128828]|uniref:hypothetical protein n=1 Tax=Spirillospora sp. CA-128828 TaxID=3240033 RepID=UPI003D93A6A1